MIIIIIKKSVQDLHHLDLKGYLNKILRVVKRKSIQDSKQVVINILNQNPNSTHHKIQNNSSTKHYSMQID